MKKNKGITLIALVITIIVMLILVVVTIRISTKGGLFDYAGKAARETKDAIADEKDIADGKITIGGVKYNSIDEYLAKYKTEPIPTTESYVGYYADINDDGTVDGVIYADLAFDANGTWSSRNSSTFSYKASSNLKNYTISTKTYEGQTTAGTYTAKGFGEKSVLVPNGEIGNDRFYVMALENFTDGTNTTFNWYYNAYGNMSDYATATSTAFGTGKANTLKMIEYWNAETPYGTQNTRDLWGVIQNSENYDIVESVNDSKKWFVPSKDEWSAFGSNLGITSDDYNSKYGLYYGYWSSSQNYTITAWLAFFVSGYLNNIIVNSNDYVRLSATF